MVNIIICMYVYIFSISEEKRIVQDYETKINFEHFYPTISNGAHFKEVWIFVITNDVKATHSYKSYFVWFYLLIFLDYVPK